MAMNIWVGSEIILDFLEVHGFEDMVDRVKASGRRAVVATPRVLEAKRRTPMAILSQIRA